MTQDIVCAEYLLRAFFSMENVRYTRTEFIAIIGLKCTPSFFCISHERERSKIAASPHLCARQESLLSLLNSDPCVASWVRSQKNIILHLGPYLSCFVRGEMVGVAASQSAKENKKRELFSWSIEGGEWNGINIAIIPRPFMDWCSSSEGRKYCMREEGEVNGFRSGDKVSEKM